ncbi:putative peptidase A22B, signal peptide peptidase [Helianthus anomalus]
MLLRCFMAYECWYHSMCILVVCLEAEAAIKLDKLLKDASDEYMSTKVSYFSGVFEITNTSVIVFIVVSSCFLVWLYKKCHTCSLRFWLSYSPLVGASSIFFFSFSGSANVLGGFISMGVALIITVIQIIQVPNLKVIMVLSVGVGFR